MRKVSVLRSKIADPLKAAKEYYSQRVKMHRLSETLCLICQVSCIAMNAFNSLGQNRNRETDAVAAKGCDHVSVFFNR